MVGTKTMSVHTTTKILDKKGHPGGYSNGYVGYLTRYDGYTQTNLILECTNSFLVGAHPNVMGTKLQLCNLNALPPSFQFQLGIKYLNSLITKMYEI